MADEQGRPLHGEPLHLHASLTLSREEPSHEDLFRDFRWLTYEADAFEDGLDKILYRKEPVPVGRAIQLAQNRLARHVHPSEDHIRSRSISEVNHLGPMIDWVLENKTQGGAEDV